MTHRPSLKDSLDKWEEHLFCGRDAEVAKFNDILNRPSRPTTLVSIYGIGGVGKSTLVRALSRHSKARGAFTAISSADNSSSPISILLEFGFQIGRNNETKNIFSDFFEKIERLQAIENKLRSKIQEDENTVGKVAIEATKGGVGSAAGVALGAAIAGPIGAVAGGALGGALGPLVENASKDLRKSVRVKSLSNDDNQFLANAETHLTESFLLAINSLATHNKVALLFDAIEYLGETIKWLQNRFLAGLRQRGVIIVLAGRYALSRNQWLAWTPRLVEIELQPFTRETTYEFLTRYGVGTAKIKEFIHEQTAGLPLAVALSASYSSQIVLAESQQSSYFETETAQIIEIVTESFLKNLSDEKLREALRVCSIPRWFNLELLSQLLEFKAAEREYDLLSNLRPAIRIRPYGLSLHDTMREYLSKSLSLRSPNFYNALQLRARDYFENIKKQLEATNNEYSEEWQMATLEWIYHQLVLGEISCFQDEIERSSRYYQHTFARRLITDVKTYQNTVQGIAGVYAYHKGQNLVHHNDFLSAIEVFTSINKQIVSLSEDSEFENLVTYQLGKAHFWLGEISIAEAYFKEVLQHFESVGNLRMQSHVATFLSKIHETRGELKSAIFWRIYSIKRIKIILRSYQKDDKHQRDYADMLFSLGEAARLRGSFTIALEIHRRCINTRMKLKNEFDIGESHISIAKCFMSLAQYTEAETNLKIATTIYESTNDNYMLGEIRLLLGQKFLVEGKVAQAIAEFKKATHLAEDSQHRKCLTEAKSLLRKIELSNPDVS